jgi:hypothetical protein
LPINSGIRGPMIVHGSIRQRSIGSYALSVFT